VIVKIVNGLFTRPAIFLAALLSVGSQSSPAPVTPGDRQLAPTLHPALPANESDLWLVPSARDRAARTIATYEPLAAGIKRYKDGDYAGALALVTRPTLAGTALASYAAYYAGLSQLRLGRLADARRTFDALLDRKPPGYVAIAAALASGDVAESAGDYAAAVRIYDRIADQKAAVTDEVLSRLARVALAAGDRTKAAGAYVRVYYEFPLTDAATLAGAQLAGLQDQIRHTGYKLDLGRAQLLFGARRYGEARAAFQDLQRVAEGDDKELVDLRVAECDFQLKQYAAARDGVLPYLARASRKAEARFFYLSSLRELGDHPQYIAQTAALVADFPDSSWAEEALNNLGSHYLVTNDDALAARTFKELYDRFPTGTRSERAAWKYGWWSYRRGDYRETVRVFESAALAFPRSDYRPSFLYWAGRSHGKLGAASQSDARLRLVYADYANSYYGRLAERHLARRGAAPPDGVRLASRQQLPEPAAPPVPTESLIRLLLANGLYEDALAELRYAQRVSGSSTRIEATIAWTYHQMGELRRAITLMRRAYPQHLTAGGDQLPAEILQVIFPLTYWESIRKQSARHGLDPYLVAALIAQESTFDPQVRSVANAWGLMQIVPATGRRLAQSLGIRRFTTATLTNAEINIRMGTLHFSRLVEQFGGTYYALASYNAGGTRVVRWKAERPGLEEDEFIDDIPFPETQNYVKRILGTAEDYRMLYGRGEGTPRAAMPAPKTTGNAPARTPTAKAPAKKPTAKAPVKKPTVKKKAPPKKKAPARPSSTTRRR
jgi:soluble lytic murein transglycosylase